MTKYKILIVLLFSFSLNSMTLIAEESTKPLIVSTTLIAMLCGVFGFILLLGVVILKKNYEKKLDLKIKKNNNTEQRRFLRINNQDLL